MWEYLVFRRMEVFFCYCIVVFDVFDYVFDEGVLCGVSLLCDVVLGCEVCLFLDIKFDVVFVWS